MKKRFIYFHEDTQPDKVKDKEKAINGEKSQYVEM